MLVDAGVAVAIEVDPRNDTASDGDTVSPNGVADDADLAFQLGHITNGEVLEVFKRGEVEDFEESEVTVVCYVKNACWVFAWRAVDGNEQAARIGHNVGVGQKTVFPDEESCASATAEATCFPWFAVVGHLSGSFNTDNGAVDVSGLKWWLRR